MIPRLVVPLTAPPNMTVEEIDAGFDRLIANAQAALDRTPIGGTK